MSASADVGAPRSGRRVHAVAALENREFRLFYPTVLGDAIGSMFQQTAVLWQVYELTSSALHLGLTSLGEGLSILAFSLVGGVIADGMDRRRLIVTTQALAGVLNLALAGLTATGQVQVWHIYVFAMSNAALTATSGPARTALVASLVPRHHLLNALTLNFTARRVARLAGPALAGFSIALFGVATTYAINGAVYLVTLTALAAIRLAPSNSGRGESPLKSLLDGLSFVRRRSVIGVLVAMDAVAMLFGSFRVLLPVFARDLGVGAEGLGLLLSAPAAGGLLAAGVVMSLGEVRRKGLLVLGGLLAYCAALSLLAVSAWFWLSLLATGALGAADAFQAILRNAAIQAITPNELRGRVTSFQTTFTMGGPALGRAQLGGLATLLGAPLALLLCAVVCAAVLLGIAARWPELRKADL